MDASQYKDYVLVLLFIKYVSDKYAGQPFAPISIPDGSSFKDMVSLKGKTDNEADQLFFDQIIEAALRVDMLELAASANSVDKFQLVFRQILESLFIERMDTNEDLFARFMNEGDFQRVVADWLGTQVYQRFTKKSVPQEV